MNGLEAQIPRFRRSRAAKAALKLGFALVLGVLLFEAALTILLPPFEYLDAAEADDYLWVKFKPGTDTEFFLRKPSILGGGQVRREYRVRINSMGLREDRELARPKPKDVFRVLCLGDSITFGWGLPEKETYPRQLEARMRSIYPSRKIEVINAGYPGYSSRQGLIWLDRELLELGPELVIVAFGFNDSLPSWFRTRGPIRLDNDMEVMAGTPGAWVPIHRSRLEHLAYLLSETFTAKLAMVFYTWIAGQGPVYEATGGLTDGRAYEWARVPPGDYRENLSAIVKLSESRGAKVIVVYTWGTPEAYRSEVETAASDSHASFVSQAGIISSSLSNRAGIISEERFRDAVKELKEQKDPFPPGVFSLLLCDFIHPNLIGNALFVDELVKIIPPP